MGKRQKREAEWGCEREREGGVDVAVTRTGAEAPAWRVGRSDVDDDMEGD